MDKLLLLAAVIVVCSSAALIPVRSRRELVRTSKDAPSIMVDTTFARIFGRVNGRESISFFDIPYAKPPVGELRFKPPVFRSSYMLLDSRSKGPSCVQLPSSLPKSIEKKNNISEDCLTLDIHIDGTSINTTDKLPVLVFIHGGSFVSGSSSAYDLSKFVTGRKIIAIAIQYRLGLLGFAQSPSENAIPGNNGLQDQVAALKWIKKYIHEFGGDADQVTVAGESAGSISIAYHLVSPSAGGLIKRAILESGAHRTLNIVKRDQIKSNTEQVIRETGCNRRPNVRAQYKCLRNVPVKKLLDAQKKLSAKYITFTPTRDSSYFRNLDPVKQVQRGNFTNKLDSMIVGQNGNEGASFLGQLLRRSFPLSGFPRKQKWFAFECRAMSPFMPKFARSIWWKIVDFTFLKQNAMDEIKATNTMGKFLGDELFNCPTRELVQLYIKANPKTNVYYYNFLPRPLAAPSRKLMPYIKDAIHGEELQFVYGQPLLDKVHYTEEEVELSRRLIDEWTTFVRTGAVADIKWPRVVYNQKGVKFSHIVFKNATDTEYKDDFTKNWCRAMARHKPHSLF